VNGDLTHGLVVGTALRTLGTWMAILRARTRPGGQVRTVFESVERARRAFGEPCNAGVEQPGWRRLPS
jgi:hypothetical protein